MPRKSSYLESWLGGQLRVGHPHEWSFADRTFKFGPERGGRYLVTQETDGVLVQPIPPASALRKFWHLNVCDGKGEWRRLRRVTPFVLKNDTFRTSHGLRLRTLQLLNALGAEIEFLDERPLTPESRNYDPDAAHALFAKNPVLHSAILLNDRGVLRHANPNWREATFRRILGVYPDAYVGVIVPSKAEVEYIESIFREVGRKAQPDEYGEIDESKSLGIVGLPMDFCGVPFRPLDIVVYWRAETLRQRRAQLPILVNRGFPNRAYAFLHECVGLDSQELQQLEFYVGPLIWDRGAVEHGWTTRRFRCSGWPKCPPRTSDGRRKLWTSSAVRDDVLGLARKLQSGETIEGLYDATGRRCRLSGPTARRVAIVCESAKTACLLAEAAPEYRLLTPNEKRGDASSGQPAIFAELCLNRVGFDYDTVISLGMSGDTQSLKSALAHAKAFRTVMSPPDAFTFLEPMANR